jgi:hypothetical protein
MGLCVNILLLFFILVSSNLVFAATQFKLPIGYFLTPFYYSPVSNNMIAEKGSSRIVFDIPSGKQIGFLRYPDRSTYCSFSNGTFADFSAEFHPAYPHTVSLVISKNDFTVLKKLDFKKNANYTFESSCLNNRYIGFIKNVSSEWYLEKYRFENRTLPVYDSQTGLILNIKLPPELWLARIYYAAVDETQSTMAIYAHRSAQKRSAYPDAWETVTLIDLKTGKTKAILDGFATYEHEVGDTLKFFGSKLVVNDRMIYDLKTQSKIQIAPYSSNITRYLEILPNQNVFLLEKDGERLQAISLYSPQGQVIYKKDITGIYSMAISPNKSLVALNVFRALPSDGVYVFNIQTGVLLIKTDKKIGIDRDYITFTKDSSAMRLVYNSKLFTYPLGSRAIVLK